MSILNSFNIKANFWQVNPQLCAVDPLATLYNGDKSKDKSDSSKIMWAIALVFDIESKYFNIPLDDRKKIIARDYLKNDKFDFNKYKEYIEFYEKLTLTPARRHLIIWNNKLDEKTTFLEGLQYNEQTAELIEKLLISNTKLYAELERISEELVKEGDSGIVKGGSEESISEKGEM